MKKIFYEAVEKGGALGDEKSMLIENPNSKEEGLRWCRFKTLKGAKRAIEKGINNRKHQYKYFRDKDGKIVDKLSYYEEYKLTYKIYKVVEEEEVVFETNNDDIQLRKINKEGLQEELPLIGSPL